MNLASDAEPIVYDAVMAELAEFRGAGELIGISCIARGADSIFARAVLDSGGRLEVVLPTADYRQTKVRPIDAPQFDLLLSRSSRIHVASSGVADRAAYEAANKILLSSGSALFAIWDGEKGASRGGTASVVELAGQCGVPVKVIWPTGARRE